METYRRDAPVTLHAITGLESHVRTKDSIHHSVTEESASGNDAEPGRETYSSPEELQDRLEEDGDGSDVTAPNRGSEQTTVLENSDPDSGRMNPSRMYVDEALPDLLRSGCAVRRRVSSPVSVTLKQVKKEVELSRQRSLKLKAQVDRLQQQNEGGSGWGQNRQRVTEEVQSVVKLLLPLSDIQASDLPSRANPLDAALAQLQNVARRIALNHTSQGRESAGEDHVILQQALRDRDEAIAKKQAMETELLKSKNEMMTLNNQLLEAVQSRLELAVELEAWKDDVQIILHHQLLKQQEEQNQKKSRGFGVLRRSNKPLPPKPVYSSVTNVPSPSQYSAPDTQRWKDTFKRGRASVPEMVVEPQSINSEDNFQVISLD